MWEQVTHEPAAKLWGCLMLLGLYSYTQYGEGALGPSLLPEQLSPSPTFTPSLFWNLPPPQGPSLCFLASSAFLFFKLFLLKAGAHGAEPHSPRQHREAPDNNCTGLVWRGGHAWAHRPPCVGAVVSDVMETSLGLGQNSGQEEGQEWSCPCSCLSLAAVMAIPSLPPRGGQADCLNRPSSLVRGRCSWLPAAPPLPPSLLPAVQKAVDAWVWPSPRLIPPPPEYLVVECGGLGRGGSGRLLLFI